MYRVVHWMSLIMNYSIGHLKKFIEKKYQEKIQKYLSLRKQDKVIIIPIIIGYRQNSNFIYKKSEGPQASTLQDSSNPRSNKYNLPAA